MATTPIINAQLDTINGTLTNIAAANAMIAGKIGAMSAPTNWAGYQALVRTGTAGLYAVPGDQLEVQMSSMVTAYSEGTGITDVSVDPDTFLAAAGTEKSDYTFSYDGTNWKYDGSVVSLTTYGLFPTGTPASGDIIIVHRTSDSNAFNILGLDEDVPANPNLEHTVTIQMDGILSRASFDVPQYLFPVTQESLTAIGITGTVLPAGTYHVTLDHGAYNGSTSEDGSYKFTTTQPVPIGGGIRHTTIGTALPSGTGYGQAHITGGTFITYDADTVTVIEEGLATTTGTTGTNLGTATAIDPQYKTGDFINFTQRQAYGSNRLSTSYLFQLLNSRDAQFQFVPATVFSRNASISPEGFLHSLDPELKNVLVKVRKRLALPISDGGGYEDVEAYCFPATGMDVFGGGNNSIYEGPVNANGDVTRQTAYTFWQENNTASDRIKYQANVPFSWWLASANTQNGVAARYVSVAGESVLNSVYSSRGVVPVLFIG